MKEISFLSISRGNAINGLCDAIVKSDRDKPSREKGMQAIELELSYLIRKRPVLWDRPEADKNYYELLLELKRLLENNASIDEITAFSEKIKKITRKKIHALFLVEEESCWPSMESVYQAAANSQDYHATLVYTPFKHKNLAKKVDYYNVYKYKYGLPVVTYDKYDLEMDSPDVVFMIKPYNGVPLPYQPKSIMSVVPRVVYIPYGMEITEDLIKYAFQHYLQYKAWRHCAYGPVVKTYAEKYGYRNGENVVVWGHPKADLYRQNIEISSKLKQFINGRRTILWTPHHLVDLSKTGTGTWLIWGRQILDVALKNPDIAFIFRPHPMMMGALLNNKLISKKEAKEIKKLIDSSSNIIWDKNESYAEAFEASDAIITDGTTFSIEYLYSKKPILLTPRNMSGFYMNSEMMESYYVVKHIKDVEDFIDLIRNGFDPLFEKRMKFRDEMLFVPENKSVGQNIIENVKKDLFNDSYIEILKNAE